jgi:uncharacterized membrane protein
VDDLFQLIPLIVVVLAILGRIFRSKKPRESEPEVVLEGEQEVTLPPWGNIATMEDNAGEPLPDFPQLEERSPSQEATPPLPAAKETQPAPDTTASKPEERPAPNRAERRNEATSAQSAPSTVAGISLTPQTFRQGIILREILGPPKSLQRRRAETEN